MSMNFSEFKKLIGADPWNRDPETMRARNSAPEFETAARDAEAFEGKLLTEIELEEVRNDPEWEPAEKLLEKIQAEKAKASKQKRKRR